MLNPLINKIYNGGFAETNLILEGAAPISVERISDNEVHAIYQDPTNEKVQWKEIITADGSGMVRKNFKRKREKVVVT